MRFFIFSFLSILALSIHASEMTQAALRTIECKFFGDEVILVDKDDINKGVEKTGRKTEKHEYIAAASPKDALQILLNTNSGEYAYYLVEDEGGKKVYLSDMFSDVQGALGDLICRDSEDY